MVTIQRRELLQLGTGGIVGTSLGESDRPRLRATDGSSSGDESQTDSDDFDPAVHGLGFSNWSGDTGTDTDGREFIYDPGDVSREDVGRAIDDHWTTALSEAQRELMRRIVYSWIGRNAATNGHCYGMAFAADTYFRDPSELPAGVDSASEIPRPTDEYSDVGDRIRRYQASQLLRAEPFWFAFLGLHWGLADHRESLGALTGAIDASGTCGLALDGEANAHLVLAYDYERSNGVTDVFVYDPNYEAADHMDPETVWTLSVEDETGEVLEIAEGYEEFLYHDPEMDHTVADDLIGGRERVLEELSNAVFLGLETGGALEIDVPEDVRVDRPDAEYADPDGGPYADAAVVFGPLEEFEVSIDGEAGAEYSLDALGLREGDLVLDEVVSDTLEEVPVRLQLTIDEAGEFVVDVVEDVEEGAEESVENAEESIEEADEGTDWIEDNWWIAAAGGALGLGLGAARRLLANRSDDEDET